MPTREPLVPFRLRVALAALVVCTPASVRAQGTPPPVAPAAALEPPRLLSEGNVAYPEGATGAATVVLIVKVTVEGTVSSAVPTEPQEPFSTSASLAAMSWRYEPAKRDGRPVASKIRVAIEFHPAVLATPASPAPETSPLPPPPSPAPVTKALRPPDEVEVRGAHEEPSRTATLSRAEVRQIPGAFGDPFRAIEIMPGVTPIVSGLPFFYIRGAPPGNVGYFLDDIRVPYLFHVGVGPSVVHPALVERVDLYPGGYPARFGRFAGGVVSGKTVELTEDVHGEYNARLVDAGAYAEAPFAGGRGTVLLGGRYSYTGLVLSLLSPDTVLSYWDYQARVTYALTPRDRVGVFAFGADDFLGQKAAGTTTTVFGVQFHRVDLRYDHRLADDGTMRTAITLGQDLTDVGDGQSTRDRLVHARTEIAYRASPAALVRAGADAQTDSYDVLANAFALPPSQAAFASRFFPSRTDFAAGLHGDVVLTALHGFEVTPGARLDYFASKGSTAVAVDPRLAARVAMNGRASLLWAMGLAHQPPSFTIPIPGFQPGGLSGGLQTALQESMGVEWDLGRATTATVTAFHNGFFDMSDALGVTAPQIEGCAPGSFPTDTLAGDPGGIPRASTCTPRFPTGTLGPDRSGGDGQAASSRGDTQTIQALETRTSGTAYGLELFVKRRLTERFGGFLSYTLSRSTRAYGNQTFVSSFDRTHVLNVAAAYDLGRMWRVGARLTFYTGLPKAPDPTSSSTRLSPFTRLDVRLEKRWQLGRRTWISFVAEWLNVTFSKEEVGTRCTLTGCQAMTVGPITIPSFGVEGGF